MFSFKRQLLMTIPPSFFLFVILFVVDFFLVSRGGAPDRSSPSCAEIATSRTPFPFIPSDTFHAVHAVFPSFFRS